MATEAHRLIAERSWPESPAVRQRIADYDLWQVRRLGKHPSKLQGPDSDGQLHFQPVLRLCALNEPSRVRSSTARPHRRIAGAADMLRSAARLPSPIRARTIRLCGQKPMLADLARDCFGGQAAPFLFLTFVIQRFLTGTRFLTWATVFVVGALILIVPGERLQRALDGFYHVFAATGSFSNAPWRELAVGIEDHRSASNVSIYAYARATSTHCVS